METPLLTVKIPVTHLKKSTNAIYSGQHWTQRKNYKDSVFDTATIFCRKLQPIISYPVEIRYHFSFGTRAQDTLNCAYTAKTFEDAFRSLGILKDDSPAYVARSVIEVSSIPTQKSSGKTSNKTLNKEDWLIITINEI